MAYKTVITLKRGIQSQRGGKRERKRRERTESGERYLGIRGEELKNERKELANEKTRESRRGGGERQKVPRLGSAFSTKCWGAASCIKTVFFCSFVFKLHRIPLTEVVI